MTKEVMYPINQSNSIYTTIRKGASPSRSSLHTDIGWVVT